jgi:hypothetical protein
MNYPMINRSDWAIYIINREGKGKALMLLTLDMEHAACQPLSVSVSPVGSFV